jgi:hypothetical protein
MIVFSFFAAPWMRFTDKRMAEGLTEFISDSELAQENNVSPLMVGVWVSLAAPSGVDCNLTAFALLRGSIPQCDNAEEEVGTAIATQFEAQVRWVEYSLLLILFTALTGVILGLVALKSKNFNQYIPLMVIGGFLAFYPVIWQQMYNFEVKNWVNDFMEKEALGQVARENKETRNFVEDSLVALIETGYNTTLFTVLGLLILITGLVGFLLGDDPKMVVRIPISPKSDPTSSPFS